MADGRVRDAVAEDAGRLAEIYNHYVVHTIVTFGSEPVTAAAMAADIEAADDRRPLLVWEDPGGAVAGFAMAGSWQARCAFANTVETTVYLDPERVGGGRGTRLYAALLDRLRAAGLRTALGGIALPNPASVALHEKLGFRKVAHLERVGDKLGREIDVGYWQLIL